MPRLEVYVYAVIRRDSRSDLLARVLQREYGVGFQSTPVPPSGGGRGRPVADSRIGLFSPSRAAAGRA
ncbi:hypothetical protein ACFRMQ_25465 [Kitasatospora sp. NPDC056783]|uniref:hypothetical protein n=1 Tax=Kitasatospora sp. NPDC056783 TaxID=3345943 RepID=UPI0036C8680B